MDFMDIMRVKLVDDMRTEMKEKAKAREPKFVGYYKKLQHIYTGEVIA